MNDVVFVEGEKVLVRTVTFFLLGQVEKVLGNWLFLSDASWVADTGRFGEALSTGRLAESEKVPGTVRVHLGSVVDVFEWAHALPETSI